MPDTQTSHPATTIARYVVGVASVLGFVWSMWIMIRSYCAELSWLFSNGDSTGENWNTAVSVGSTDAILGLSLAIGGPPGYLLFAKFCLLDWTGLARREGFRACRLALAVMLLVGAVGTLVTGFSSQTLYWGITGIVEDVDVASAQEVLVFMIGFWMLWGFLLASGIRKLRRMKRAANAE